METRLYQLKKQNVGVEIGNTPLNALFQKEIGSRLKFFSFK